MSICSPTAVGKNKLTFFLLYPFSEGLAGKQGWGWKMAREKTYPQETWPAGNRIRRVGIHT